MSDTQESATDAARRMARKVNAVEILHSRRVLNADGYTMVWCPECRQDWPCRTLEAMKWADDE